MLLSSLLSFYWVCTWENNTPCVRSNLITNYLLTYHPFFSRLRTTAIEIQIIGYAREKEKDDLSVCFSILHYFVNEVFAKWRWPLFGGETRERKMKWMEGNIWNNTHSLHAIILIFNWVLVVQRTWKVRCSLEEYENNQIMYRLSSCPLCVDYTVWVEDALDCARIEKMVFL